MTVEDTVSSCPRCGAAVDRTARFCGACGYARTVDVPEDDTLLGTTLLGRYRIVSVIGQGGMGRVYRGEQQIGRATRQLAIKILAPKNADGATVLERFHREAAAVLTLQHPCTVRAYDFAEEQGRHFLVMEYVVGERLADTLARGPMPLARVSSIVVQIAGSLDEAHHHGIVHRDLKPENVILTGAVGSQFVKVLDFGVAKYVTHEQQNPAITARGVLVGTPAYMSPEQFGDIGVDARSDVYALGMLTYRMLAGAPPWPAKNVYEWATCHTREPVPPLEQHAPGLPSRVYAAVHRALAKLPSERPQSAGEFARELVGLQPGVDPWAAIAAGDLATSDTAARAAPAVLPTISESGSRSRRPSPWVVFTALFVLAVGFGFFAIAMIRRPDVLRGVMARRTTATRPDAGRAMATAVPDAGSAAPIDQGAVHPNWPRAQPILMEGLVKAQSGDLDGALAALETAQDLIGPSTIKLHDLRARAAELGAAAIRRDLHARHCDEARQLSLRLRHVGAEGDTYRLYGPRCRPP